MTTTVQTLTVRDIMSRSLVTLAPDMTLREAIEAFDREEISGAPVVAGGAVVGVLSTSDLVAFETTMPAVPTTDIERAEPEETERIRDAEEGNAPISEYFFELWDDAGADVVERTRTSEGPEWDVLGEHTVGEAMTAGVRTVQAGASLAEAASYMLDQRIHRALVLDGDRLVGLVTTTDFLRAIAER